jgi:hypothetical protein
VVVGVLGAGQAQALVVNVGGQQWDVTTFTGSYNANSAKFNTPANGGKMPWWTGTGGSSTLASQFAAAITTSLGLQPGTGSTYSPYFAYKYLPINCTIGVDCTTTMSRAWDTDTNIVNNPSDPATFTASLNQYGGTLTWAQAELVAPVPGPLPLFGAAAAFGFSRNLRNRIKDSKAVGGSITVD